MRTLLAIALLCSASLAEAGPIDWMRRHPTATALIVGSGAATIHGLGLRHCRETGVEKCQAKYGAAWASFGVATGVNLAVVASTKDCWKEHDAKFCALFGYGGSTAQVGFGVSQWLKGGKNADSTTTVTRSASSQLRYSTTGK